MPPSLLLASQSPRRRELLDQIGVAYIQQATQVEEVWQAGESPSAYVQRLALAKARAGLKLTAELPVLGADTIVVSEGQIVEKPRDRAHAYAIWSRLSGKSHQVMSALALVDGSRALQSLSVTQVYFRELDESAMARYWASGEPADKAGGYGIQGLGAVWVERIEGSYSGVVGLPIEALVPLLESFQIPYWAGS
ncbi:Maf family protein [Simiduia agarivorans]|uniref:dTTP/UTP pyrophosphatase n=1 Tax=Simiduia agarivorans (strain DSM 21679 / JCM 13881 / BCRC 17597 / SA1) TaxID=1117647 RepID=H8YI01_SIMAS|nr:nucleoside triphosphate pyrophosphatase [Simiduia agarivorans]AFD30851.1 Maf1 [Simiduia agarivorans SA1 = DSM 21679]AFV00630.1 Maf-like protein [Simiduia agarivorans SA1 = DSM 21679]